MAFLKDELTGFVPTEQAKEIMKDVARGSSVLRLSKVEPMTSDKKTFPVMTEGPGAYWVGEGERIQTSKAQWIFPEMEAKKLAVIIPVTKGMYEGYEEGVYLPVNSSCELHSECYRCEQCTLERTLSYDEELETYIGEEYCIVCGHGTCTPITEDKLEDYAPAVEEPECEEES